MLVTNWDIALRPIILNNNTPVEVSYNKGANAWISHKDINCYRETILNTSNTVTCRLLAISRSPRQTVLYQELHKYIKFL